MNNLTLFLLGLVLINVPSCLSQCFSKSLQPPYPCCTGNKILFTDEDGNWGIENGEWCGIGGASSDSCFSITLGYKCCPGNKILYSDENGNWGIENGEWCGIGFASSDSCFSVAQGYKCCQLCNVLYTDNSGNWGVENGEWCGIKDSCNSDIVEGNKDFDFVFLKMENEKKNKIYSPLSIKYALRMLQEGAEGNTFTEINKVIGNTELTKYKNIGKNLSFANGMFIRENFYPYVKPEYITTLMQKYEAEVIKDKFESARNANKWIEDKTLGIIKNMLSDELVQDPETAILLINALAIEMEWYHKFSFSNTSGDFFNISDGKSVRATMMSLRVYDKSLSYYKGNDVTAVTMDLNRYGETELEFMAIMPKGDLSSYIKNVTKEKINEIDNKLNSASQTNYGVEVNIPKFKFSYDLKLKEDLNDLGIKAVFDEKNADLSKIANSEGLKQKPYVSDALHKADIEFTENGIKAAAVTVIVIKATKGLPQKTTTPIYVTIDNPFMFIIRDKNTKDIWFTGTVYEPNLWENDKLEYTSQGSSTKTLPPKMTGY